MYAFRVRNEISSTLALFSMEENPVKAVSLSGIRVKELSSLFINAPTSHDQLPKEDTNQGIFDCWTPLAMYETSATNNLMSIGLKWKG